MMLSFRCHTCQKVDSKELSNAQTDARGNRQDWPMQVALPAGWFHFEMVQSGDALVSKRDYCSLVCVAHWAIDMTDAHDHWRMATHKAVQADATTVKPGCKCCDRTPEQ